MPQEAIEAEKWGCARDEQRKRAPEFTGARFSNRRVRAN
jgi:hypothetical protein